MSEVNVKEIKFVDGTSRFCEKVKCNFKILGKKFSSNWMKQVAAAVTE